MWISRSKWILWAGVVVVSAAIVFTVAQADLATESIQFDLKKIGESIYEARSRSGRWPTGIGDLEGTSYLKMPYRRDILERKHFVIVWPEDFDPDPKANANRTLAYDNGSLLARLGRVWACRGDLRIERLSAQEVATLNSGPRALR